ncbi:MAG: hypothetical protein UY96_C0003G0005 [Parcubacteria group bacterium GW2011_GWB1_56_8]|nr:MAG: hypothetical protein UY96_C0003G0005 [Parcubacteria group bacterium GW2011_GWB1_56_8]
MPARSIAACLVGGGFTTPARSIAACLSRSLISFALASFASAAAFFASAAACAAPRDLSTRCLATEASFLAVRDRFARLLAAFNRFAATVARGSTSGAGSAPKISTP